MARRDREIVVVDRGDSSVKWLLWGALIGAGVALLYAPTSGEETRRSLQRRVRKLRAATEEKFEDLVQRVKQGAQAGLSQGLAALEADDDLEEDDEDCMDGADGDVPPPSARQELERRLAETRARRRAAGESRS
jgi:gas vesicle protein